jgi:DNA-directed RNA polymerase
MPLWDNKTGTEFSKRDSILGVNMDESMKNLRACLSVGRFNRAEAILRRLATTTLFNVFEVQEANNTYLRSLMHALFRGTEGLTLTKIQTWFEVDMRQLGIEPDATTLALMVRTAFLLSSTKARERTIRRYLHIAEEVEMLESTMSSGEYLPEEWNALCEIRKDLFKELPQEEEEAATNSADPLVQNAVPSPPPLDIKACGQKGLGLGTLLQGLRSLYVGEKTGELDDFSRNSWQVGLEEDIVTAELERWRTQHAEMMKMGINPAMTSKYMEAILWEWQERLQASIQTQLDEMQLDTAAYMQGDGPYLEQVGAEKLAAVTILETIRSMNQEGMAPKIYKVTNNIGVALELEGALKTFQQRKENKARHIQHRHRKSVLQQLRKQANTSNKPTDTESEDQRSTESREQRSIEWPKVVKLRSAAMLLSKLIEVSKFPVIPEDVEAEAGEGSQEVKYEPAFAHSLVYYKGKRQGIIKAHPELQKRLSKEPPPSNLAHQLPMVAKPEPWTDSKGAYLRYPASLMRLKDVSGIQDMYMHAAIQEGNLDKVFKGLTVLGKTEWMVNRRVFDVMAEAWNTGEAITNLPPANPELILPMEPPKSAEKKVKYTWHREVRRLQNEHSGFHSNRCFINAQMEIARAFIGHSFFLPHNMDFRGRAYPIGGIFNHMGADNARGLFQFAKGKELGDTGLFWLRNHLANKFGFDKANLTDREQFTVEHWDDIKDSAADPLNGKKWWLKAEDPWQCLAACFELVAAMESEDPTTYVSYLPVHQDGTCNGLQHYAALGGDSLGAAQVNLLPRDKPGDIYSEVARLVIEDIKKDEAKGDPLAKCLSGKISRKVVKQPVMTYAYGVTYYGAKQQILKRLDEIIPNSHNIEYGNSILASYVTQKVFENFGALFTGSTRIQHWLAACAGRISTAVAPEQIEHVRNQSKKGKRGVAKKLHGLKFQSAVIWTTPLNLPVVQPYRQIDNTKMVSTALQQLKVLYPSAGDVVLKRKQMAGFPPNFIHSLDATHMLLSAIKCDEQDLTFASVHDSFWTHACDVPKMNENLRDAFVQIHSEDIIGRLGEEFNARYKSFMYQRSVPLASPFGQRINNMRAKRLKNSKTKAVQEDRRKVLLAPSLDELIEEYDRLKLLKSEDPTDRLQAESIETPASLYEALGSGHADLLYPEDAPVVESDLNETAMPLNAELADDIAREESSVAEVIQDPVFLANSGLSPDSTADAAADSSSTPDFRIIPKKRYRFISFWAPLEFPEVPKRGDFDVSVVKDSTYFFS